MGETTGIAWTDHTFNPWIGCTKVSAGCLNCYAERQNNFYHWNPEGWGKGVPRKLTSDANWKKPIQWAKQAVKDGVTRRVFCASLADVFDDEVDIIWKDQLYQIIETCSKIGGLEWLLLTKRSERIESDLPETWLVNPPNFIRIGVTVENRKNEKRITDLLHSWRGKNFISAEPMLSKIDLEKPYCRTCDNGTRGFSSLSGFRPCPDCDDNWGIHQIDWVIAGCESGSNASPMNIEWARDLRDQCVEAGTPFFLKQMMVNGKLVVLPELDGKAWSEFPVGKEERK